jgi:hypothetical protein
MSSKSQGCFAIRLPLQCSAQSFSPANHQLDNFLIKHAQVSSVSLNPRHACHSLAHYRHGHYDTIDLLAEQMHAKNQVLQYLAVAASPLVNSIFLPGLVNLDL